MCLSTSFKFKIEKMDSLYTHITQSVAIQRQRVTLQKHAAGTKGHLFYYRDMFSVIISTDL